MLLYIKEVIILDTKIFSKNDEEFICNNCKRFVEKLSYTSRDHCPYCLHSVHIDNNPGDRSCSCLGDLVPIGVEKSKNGLYKIIYKCDKCKIIKKNIQAVDDDINEIIKISVVK